MLRLRFAPHFNAVLASALIGSFLLAFMAVANAGSAGAAQIPTVNVPGHQLVTVINNSNGKMTFTGHIQLNLFNKPTAKVLNQAISIGSCTSCETLGIAMQINVASSLTSAIDTTNSVLALNHNCLSCLTEADAIQVWILSPQSNLTMPQDAKNFVAQMNQEFSAIGNQLDNQPNISASQLNQAMSGINQVLAQNSYLMAKLITRFAKTTQTNTP